MFSNSVKRIKALLSAPTEAPLSDALEADRSLRGGKRAVRPASLACTSYCMPHETHLACPPLKTPGGDLADALTLQIDANPSILVDPLLAAQFALPLHIRVGAGHHHNNPAGRIGSLCYLK